LLNRSVVPAETAKVVFVQSLKNEKENERFGLIAFINQNAISGQRKAKQSDFFPFTTSQGIGDKKRRNVE